MTIRLRVRAAIATASLVTPLVGAAFVASPAQAANDPKPQAEAATWLAGQLKPGILQNGGFPDYGLTIDAATVLQQAGNHDADVAQVRSELAQNPRDYYTYTYQGTTTTYANPLGKLLAFVEDTGGGAATFGGQDLVGQLAPLVTTTSFNNSDNSAGNTIGLAFAARGLRAAASNKAADALTFLLKQQCDAGYFSLALSAGCQATGAAADPDTTSIAALQLAQLPQDNGVPAAAAKVRTWLAAQQKSDGSFGGGTSTTASNTNSTGLAGAALGALGDTAAAQKAAVWVRSVQSEQAGLCADGLTGNRGTIAYDATSYADAIAKGLPNATIVDKFRRATAQAGLVLKYAPAGGTFASTREFSRPSKSHTIRATGAAPGSTLCVSGPGTSTIIKAGADGTASTTVKAPKAGTGTFVFTDPSGRAVASPIKTLNARKLTVYVASKRIHRKGTERIVVGRLAPYEPARIKLYGSVRTATANSKGKAYFTLKAGQRARTVKVKAFGAFGGVRKGSSSFKVVR